MTQPKIIQIALSGAGNKRFLLNSIPSIVEAEQMVFLASDERGVGPYSLLIYRDPHDSRYDYMSLAIDGALSGRMQARKEPQLVKRALVQHKMPADPQVCILPGDLRASAQSAFEHAADDWTPMPIGTLDVAGTASDAQRKKNIHRPL